MKKKSTFIAFSLLSLAIMTSCKKLENNKVENSGISKLTMTEEEREASRPEMTQNQKDYMSSLPMYDPIALDKAYKETVPSKTGSAVVMAIGGSDRIFQWNGSSWDEPNTYSRLHQIEASKGVGLNAVWGTNSTHHIYRRTGWGTYVEPNIYAALDFVVPYSSTIAYGISGGQVYETHDGGVNWARLNITKATWLSVGSLDNRLLYIYDPIFEKTATERYNLEMLSESYMNKNLYRYDLTTRVSTLLNSNKDMGRVSTSSNGGVIYLTSKYRTSTSSPYNYQLWKSVGQGAFTLTTYPNETEVSSCGDNSNVWCIGTGLNIYRSPAAGDWWEEPNTAARAYKITAGYF